MERSWNIGEDGSQPLWLQWWVVDRVWSGREFGMEENRDGARIRDQKLGSHLNQGKYSHLEVRVVHCSQTQQPVCTQASERALTNPKGLKLSSRGSKFTNEMNMVERSLAEESETCV